MALFCIGLVAFLAVIPAFSAQECPVDSSCIVPPPSLGSAPPRIVPPKTTNGFFDWWYTLPYLISRSLPTSSLPQDLVTNFTSTFVAQRIPEDAVFNSYSQTYLMWAVSILAVSCIGIFFGLLFCVAGLCFCCCVCCVAQWKSKTTSSFGGLRAEPKKDRIKCLIWFFLSILVIIFMLFGFIMTCLCVWQYSTATFAFPNSIDEASSILRTYLNNTQHEYRSEAIRGIDLTSSCITDHLNGIPTAASSAVVSNYNLPSGAQRASDDLQGLMQLISNIQMNIMTLSMTGQNWTSLLNTTLSEADSLSQGATSSALQELLRNISSLANVMVEDVQLSLGVNDLSVSLDNLDPLISVVQSEVDTVMAEIVRRLSSNAVSVNTAALKAQVDQMVLGDIVNDASSIVERSLAFYKSLFLLDTSTQQGSNSYASLRIMYDYGWSISIVFCVFAGLSLMAMVLILVMGTFAYKPLPELRTTLAEFTRLALRIFTAYLFLFGFMFCIFTALYFCVGANFTKTCEAVSGPDYSGLDETLSNPQWRQDNLVGKFTGQTNQNLMRLLFSSNATSSSILSQCYAGGTAWQVFELADLWSSSGVIANLRTVTDRFDTIVMSYDTASVETSLSGISSEVASLSNAVDLLQGVPIAPALNVSNLQTSTALLSTSRGILTTAQDMLNAVNGTEELSDLSKNIAMLLSLLSTLEVTQNELNTLTATYSQSVVNLQSVLNMLRIDASNFSTDINSGATTSSSVALGVARCRVASAANRTAITEQLVYYNTSSCYPLWEAYSEVYTAACGDFLGPINGLWFSMGWFMLGVIPSIVLFLGLSGHYKKLDLPRRRATTAVKPIVYRKSFPMHNMMTGGEIEMYQNTWGNTDDNTEQNDHQVRYTTVVAHSTTVETETDVTEASPYSVPVESLQTYKSEAEVHKNESVLPKDPPPSYEHLEGTEVRENLI